MNILPYRKLILHTRLTPQQCIELLKAGTTIADPECLRWREPKNTPFLGFIFCDTFKIRRVIDYRNSFLPVINGRIQPIAMGTEIAMTLKPVPLVIAFMCIWFGILLTMFLAALVNGLMQGTIPQAILVMPIMLLVGGSIMYFGFDAEYKNAKKALIAIFKSDQQQ